MSKHKTLEGKIVLVAGATRGAGRGIACMLGEAGATVYCTGRSVTGKTSTKGRPETINDTARMVSERGGAGIAVQVDHTIDEQVRLLLGRIEADHGRLDVLVNNVNGDSLCAWRPFADQRLDNGFEALKLGIQSHLLTIHAALPLMRKRSSSLIVSITDRGGGDFFYGFVKQSVMKMIELLAPELSPQGITAVSLTPGFLRSEAMLEHYGVSESNWRDAISKDPFFAGSETPCYVGRAVAALAGDLKVILKTGELLSSWELAAEYGFTDLDGSQPNPEKTFAPLVDQRWEEVVKRVRSEFKKRGFDPASVLEEDRTNLTLRARLSRDEEPPRWFKEVLGPPGVIHGNADRIAVKFCERFIELR